MKAFVFLLMFVAAQASAVEVISNFSFENGQTSWSNFNGSGFVVNYDYTAAGDTDPLDVSPKAVRVSARRRQNDTVRQNIYSALPSSPSLAGEPFRVRMKIKVDAPAYVRCQLQFQLFTGVQATTQTAVSIILADGIVRDAGQWVALDGVRNVLWPSFTPNRAWLTVEVGQIYKENLPQGSGQQPLILPTPTDKWPDFTLDYVSMEKDSDLDGLSDSYEQTLNPPSLTNDADSDHDGLPDAWEDQHGFPLIGHDDSADDPDGDHFNNLQEYWAATIPAGAGGAASYPGKTCNPNATAATKALARWLALQPSLGKRLIGQSVTTLPFDYDNYVTPLPALVQQQSADHSARWPAILSAPAEGIFTPMDIATSMSYARPYAAAGGLVVVKWAMWNPWTGGNMGSQGTGQVDVLGLVNPAAATYSDAANVSARTVLNNWLDQIALELARCLDPAFGGHPDNVVLFRPISEMNGNWFWWGHRTMEEYSGLWKYLYNYLTVVKGLNHLLWVYESAQTEHSFTATIANVSPCDYYYPGDDFVDVMGHNLYDDDWVLPHDLNRLYRRYPKIYGIPQAGTEQTAGHYVDNAVILSQVKTAFPRLSFYISWNTFPSGGSQYVNNAIISNLHAVEMMTDPTIVTRETAQWMSPWQQWAHNNLGTLASPVDGDPDGDGLKDALEYALGTAPLIPTTQALSVSQSSAASPLALTFTRNLGAADVICTIEASSDLATWQPLAQSGGGGWSVLPGCSLNQGSDGSVTFIDSVPPAAGVRRFLRLNVTIP